MVLKLLAMEIKIENESVNRNGQASTIRLPHCRQFRHYLATKSHLGWVHLLSTSNKLVNTLNNLQHWFFIWWRVRSFCFCLFLQSYHCLSKTLLFLSKVKTFVTLTEILNVLFPLLTSIYNGLDIKKSSAHR